MKRRLRKSIKIGLVLIVFVSLSVILMQLIPSYLDKRNESQSAGRVSNHSRDHGVVEPVEPTEPSELTLIATGDYMIHLTQYLEAYNADTGTYDFNEYTEHLIDIVSKADLAVVNFEGTLAQELYPLGGYPLFNAPDSVLDPLVNAGFNVVATSNNHTLDSRLDGVVSTIDAIEARGLSVFGTHKEDTDDILVKEVDGIKVAFLSYTYGFNGLEVQYTPEQIKQYLEPMDEIEMEKDIRKAEEIADITVVYPHWGNEYHREPSEYQVELAHKMVDWGADLILGSHPHVIQPSEIVQKDGLDKFIIYSMGNFVSNQRTETLDNHYTEQGVLLEFVIEKNADEAAVIKDVSLHPTWVNRQRVDGRLSYQILPTAKFVEDKSLTHLVDATTLARIERAHYEIIEHVGIE